MYYISTIIVNWILFFAITVGSVLAQQSEFHRQVDTIPVIINGVHCPQPFAGGFRSSIPTFVDIDNDGDSDLFIGELAGNLNFYQNTGTAVDPKYNLISENFEILVSANFSAPSFVDLDNDCDLDLFLGTSNGNIKFYRNTGTDTKPVFIYQTDNFSSIKVRSNNKPTFADIDNDGDFDLFVGDGDGKIHFYRNTGTATNHNFLLEIENLVAVASYAAPSFADIDNDGSLDLFVGERKGNINFYRNTGTVSNPVFVLETKTFASINVGAESAPTFADIDNDGDWDLFVGERDENVNFYRNMGTATIPFFNLETKYIASMSLGFESAPVFADIDNDRDFDLFLGNGFPGKIIFYRNTGTSTNPVFTLESEYLDSIDVGYDNKPAFADIDNDSDLDLFIGEGDGNINFYRNSGTSINPIFNLETANFASIDVGRTSAPSFADIDNDGDLDLFVGKNSPSSISFYHNTGTVTNPIFTLVTENLITGLGIDTHPTFADIDHDGDSDLFIGGSGPYIYFYKNTGTVTDPIFTLVTKDFAYIEFRDHSNPTFVDIDNDGDSDLFVGESDGGLHFYRNVTNQVVIVSLPDVIGAKGTSIAIPLTISRADGILSADIEIEYNSNVLSAINVRTTSATSGLALTTDLSKSGLIRISLSGSTPLTGNDITLVELIFDVIGTMGSTSALDIINVRFNGGAIATRIRNGSFTVAQSDICLSRMRIDFGDVTFATTKTETFTIMNIGNAVLKIDNIARTSGSSEFSMASPTNFPIFLSPNAPPITVTLNFTPSSFGEKSAVFTITSNDPDGLIEVPVSGKGILPPQPPTTFQSMRLYLMGQDKRLSEIPPEGYSGYTQEIDSNHPVAEWGPYKLNGDMVGTNYNLNIWAVSPRVNGVQTTTDFRVEVLVKNQVIVTFDFSANRYSISSGLWFSTTGMDPATSAGDEVKVRISYRGGYGGSVFWGMGEAGATYVEIPAAPYNVTRIGEFSPGSSNYAIAVVNQFVYLGSDKNFKILDAFNPLALTIVGSLPYPAEDIAISSNYAYLVYSKSLCIINVADPSNPKLVGSYNMLSNGIGVAVKDDYAYIADAYVGLKIINIKNPSTPTLVGSYVTPATAKEVVVSGDYAYVANSDKGLQIINISNPSNPTLIGNYDTPYPGSTFDLVVSGNYAYLADWVAGLKAINILNPSAPTLVGTLRTPSYAEEIAAFDNYIALAQDEGMIDFINISNPNNLILSGRGYGSKSPEDVDLQGKRAYVLEHYGDYLRIYQFQPRGPEPIIIASHRCLDFGTVYINNLKKLTFTVTNLGGADLSINNINRSDGSSEFNLITPTSFPITLKPGDLPLSVTISFSPSSTGEKVDTLNIISSDPESPNINIVLKGLCKMPLSAPTLAYPPNGSTGIPINPTLSWNASSGAASYRLQVATDLTFSTTIFDDSTIATTSKQVGPLTNNMTYYWRVRAKDAGGTSAWSNSWSFTTIIAAPLPPTLVSPSNGATGVSINPKFSWKPSNSTTSYRLQISTGSAFSTIVFDRAEIADTSYTVTGLTNNTRYYWRVNATNVGGTSNWSNVWNFTTIAVPSPPTLVSPPNGAVNQPTILTLRWNASANATMYRLQVSTSSSFSTLIFDDSTITSTSKQISSLGNNTTYYWRVNAKNSGGISNWSNIWRFTTVIAAPPKPTLVSPTNGAINQPTTLSLRWNQSARAATYRLQVSTDSTFAAAFVDDSTTTTTSQQVGPLVNNTTYYWRVNAKNAGGTSAWSTVWRFTTIIAAPSVPTLASPTNRAVNQPTTLSLSWIPSTNAMTYRTQVSTSSNFVSIIFDDSTITSTSQQISSLTNNTAYYWRVNAKNIGGTSAWSTVWSFTTIIAAPSTPTLISPGDGSVNQPTSLICRWNSVPEAAMYRIQLSTSAGFSPLVVDDSTVTTTSRQLGPLANNTKYFWRVRATNAGGASAWSTVWSFTTIITAPSVPILVSPTDGSRNQPTTLILRWNPVANAATYRVQLSTTLDFTIIVADDSTLTTVSRQLASLANSTAYYWRVNAKNIGGTSAWSSVWSFTTIIATPPPPILVSPTDGAVNQPTTLILSWNPAIGADKYRLQVSLNSSFDTTVFDDSTITTTSKKVEALANNTRYFWRVSAKNIGGTSAWSSVWRFTTIIAAPSIPILKSPSNGSVNQPTTLALNWNPSTNAATYRLQVSTSSNFVSTIFDDSTITSASKQIGSLANSTTYYWRVNAKNIGGTSAWSSVWSFTTIIATPTPPILVSPIDGAVNQPTTLILTCNPAIGADTYRLQISTGSDFTTTIFDDSTLISTSQQISSLANNTTYYWRVNAKNVGGTSVWSSVWSFTTIIARPDGITLVSPPNGAVNQPTILTLIWDSSSLASTYRLQVSTSSNFVTLILDDSTITSTSRQTDSLANNTTYYWRVNAKNAGGTSAWSSVWSFTTIIAAPPAPILASPIDEALNQPTTLILSWKPSIGAETYCLQVSKNASFDTTIVNDSTITDTSQQVGPLNNNTTYYWRVNAKNIGGTSPWSSPIGKFTTIIAAPLAPILLAPPNGAVNKPTTLTLSWNPSIGAETYRLQLSLISSFATTVVDDSTITTTSRKVGELINNSTYYWRVCAKNTGGTSPWSAPIWSFTTIIPLPNQVVLISPLDSEVIQTDTVRFIWKQSTPAINRYWFEISTDSAMTNPVIDSTRTDTTILKPDLKQNQIYWWRVKANNAAGWGLFSEKRSFNIITSVAMIDDIPDAFSLAQNYPNPFNSATIIEYNLPKPAHVELKVYDILGHEIEVLVNGKKEAGRHTVQLNGINLQSGIYFYRIRASKFVDTKKLVIMK